MQRKETKAALNNKMRYYDWFAITYTRRDVQVPQVRPQYNQPHLNRIMTLSSFHDRSHRNGKERASYNELFSEPSPVDLLWTQHPRRDNTTYTK